MVSGLVVRARCASTWTRQRLRANGLTPADVSAALQRSQHRPTRGPAQQRARRTRIAAGGGPGARSESQFAQIVVSQNAGGVALTLGDVGTAGRARAARPDSALARINGKPAVSFNMSSSSRTPTSWQDRRGGEGSCLRGAAQDIAAAGRGNAPGLGPKRLGQEFAPTALKRTLIEGALLTVGIVFLFLHSPGAPPSSRGLTLPIAVISQLHRGVRLRLHAELHDHDGASACASAC